jgi:hypothetical protein
VSGDNENKKSEIVDPSGRGMADPAEPVEGAADTAKVAPQKTPMEEDVRRRVLESIAPEIARLNDFAQVARDTGRGDDFCRAIEAVANIKSRAEVSCIQVEMAATTAAMASLFGGALRARAAQAAEPGKTPLSSAEEAADLIRKMDRPGGGSPPRRG